MIIRLLPSLLNLLGAVLLLRSVTIKPSPNLGVSAVEHPEKEEDFCPVAAIVRESKLDMMLGLILLLAGFYLQFFLIIIGST